MTQSHVVHLYMCSYILYITIFSYTTYFKVKVLRKNAHLGMLCSTGIISICKVMYLAREIIVSYEETMSYTVLVHHMISPWIFIG